MSPDVTSAISFARDSYERVQRWVPAQKLSDTLYRVSNVLLLLTALALILAIVFRTFNVDIRGMQGYAQLFTVWLSFLVAGNLEREGRHIEVNYFAKQLSERARRFADGFRLFICLFSTSFIVLSALLAVQTFWDSTIPTVNLPVSVLHAAPLIGMAFLSILYIHKFVLLFTSGSHSDD